MQKVLLFLGIDSAVEVHTDSSACIGIALRSGCGRVRHLETISLWLQQQVGNKHLQVKKVAGLVNPVDIGTKALAGPRLRSLLLLLQMHDVADQREVKAVSRGIVVDPAVVKNIVWLCALFELLGKAAVMEIGIPVAEVCSPPEQEHNEMLYKVFLLGLFAVGFLGSWLARSCCSCLAPLPPAAVTTPTQTAPTTGQS